MAIAALCFLVGCGGASNDSSGVPNAPQGLLAVNPISLQFGSVEVGTSKELTGTLKAGDEGVTINTASWDGVGFSLGGITFPKSLAAGQSTSFKVTFAPETTGSVTGSLKFFSDASSTPFEVALSGAGAEGQVRSVGLSWNASVEAVQGYYVYRGSQSGGPYARISNLLTAPSFTDTTVVAGRTYYYVVTAVGLNGVESGYSNEAVAVIPQE